MINGREVIADRYTLEREIGRGGAGTVHLAHDELLGRDVAIKRIGLLPGTTGQDIARAQREARIAAGLVHPHVVSIFDLVKDDDCYWLVMELVGGRTLTELVGQQGPLSSTRAAGIVAQAADDLVQAGRPGIVHRDDKPSNLMVDEDDQAKLGDFGIARTASDPALTQTGLVTGSPAYLAPEVASGSPATAASDVWSLGGTLFYALTGRPPYDVTENVLGGLYRIVHDDPPRLPADHPLAGLLAVMMVKDPQGRWSVERVRDDLWRVAQGRASSAAAADQPGSGRDTATLAMATTSAPPATPPPAPPAETATLESPTARPAAASGAGIPGPVRPATSGSDSGAHGSRLAWVAAVLALVLVGGVGAWLLWPGDGERPGTTAPGPATGGSQEPSAPEQSSTSAPDEPTEEPTQEPTQEPSASDEPSTTPGGGTRAAVRTFVQDYFARVTSDPQATFEMLTPEFQAESGGYERYSGFWSTISSARPHDIEVDPRALVASYTIDYVTAAGDTKTQRVQLQLVDAGDGYLIAGEA